MKAIGSVQVGAAVFPQREPAQIVALSVYLSDGLKLNRRVSGPPRYAGVNHLA